MDRRFGVLAVVVVLVVASVLLFSTPLAKRIGPVAAAPALRASAVSPSIWYNYSDFFNVPYGEWWDMRKAFGYGDEPIHADCFNLTAYNDGTCVNRVTGWPATPSYPYMDWAGSGSANSQGSATSVFAPYRANITAFTEPGYNLSQPVFLPVLNYAAAPGNSLSFKWYLQYLNKAQFTALTTAPLNCYSGSGANADDGYQIQSKISLTMDNQEALRLFGATIPTSTTNMNAWWNTNTLPGCGMTTGGKNPTAGPLEVAVDNWFTTTEGNGKYDIHNGFDLAYTSFYTNITATVLSPGASGTTQVYIEHVAWGTETLMDRWFYWGNTSYQASYLNSGNAAGWWGMENGWWEDMHYNGTLSATGMNFNLKGVLQYHFQEHSAPGPDNCFRGWTNCTEASPSDDTPYWTWGPMLLDYGIFFSTHPSELSRMGSLNYIKTTPGSGDYATNTSFDYTPVSWSAKANEWWNFAFPTSSSAFYQDPATSPIGTDPMRTGTPLPSLTSTLSFMKFFPSAYGTWDALAGTWTVNPGTAVTWPASVGMGTYPYLPYPGLYLQPANIPPGVTTNPATSIQATSATLNGNLASLGSSPSVPVGFIWGTDPTLTTGTSNTTPVTETAPTAFTYSATGLTLGTTYYFRAWASGVKFVKGAILQFNTGKTPPAVTTLAASGVAVTTATLNGNLASLGTATSASVGFTFGTTQALTTGANLSSGSMTSTGAFTYSATGLTAGTKYYFRAWAGGVGFTNATDTLNFTTSTTYPQVATDPASAVINTGASLNGHTTSLGTASSVPVGFLYGTSSALTGALNVTATTQTVPGAFTYGVTGLTAGTLYYFEAWASGNGFRTGGIQSFTTAGIAPTPPTVTTSAATSVAGTTATMNGATSALGTAASVTVGFLWGTSQTLAGAANASGGSQTAAGAFTAGLTGLTQGTKYFFEAWAYGDGFVTGSILNFTTTPAASTPPSVASAAATAVSTSSATLNGNLASLGTATSVTVGFLWSTDASLANPTNVTVGPQTATGTFTNALTGLTPGTTYYFEAWGNSAQGFVHGTIETFTTAAAPPPSEPTFLGLPAMIGYGLVAAILIVIVVAALVVFMMRKRKKSPPETPPPNA